MLRAKSLILHGKVTDHLKALLCWYYGKTSIGTCRRIDKAAWLAMKELTGDARAGYTKYNRQSLLKDHRGQTALPDLLRVPVYCEYRRKLCTTLGLWFGIGIGRTWSGSGRRVAWMRRRQLRATIQRLEGQQNSEHSSIRISLDEISFIFVGSVQPKSASFRLGDHQEIAQVQAF